MSVELFSYTYWGGSEVCPALRLDFLRTVPLFPPFCMKRTYFLHKTALQKKMKIQRKRQYKLGLTCVVSCRMTPAEHAELHASGLAAGQSLGQQLRDTYLRRPPAPIVPAINVETLTALSRMGSSLNQYVKLVNAGTIPHPGFDPALLLLVTKNLKTQLMGL